jgi:hypothetical protein
MKENVCTTEVRVCDDVIDCIQVAAADILPGQLYFSSEAQFDVTVRRDYTSDICCDYVQYVQSAEHEQEVLKKGYSEVTTGKGKNFI